MSRGFFAMIMQCAVKAREQTVTSSNNTINKYMTISSVLKCLRQSVSRQPTLLTYNLFDTDLRRLSPFDYLRVLCNDFCSALCRLDNKRLRLPTIHCFSISFCRQHSVVRDDGDTQTTTYTHTFYDVRYSHQACLMYIRLVDCIYIDSLYRFSAWINLKKLPVRLNFTKPEVVKYN